MLISSSEELIGYVCAYCKNNNWILHINHNNDGNTYLIVACSNPSCTRQIKQQLKIDKNNTVVWQEFNITGQGCDQQHMLNQKIQSSSLN